MPGNFKHSAGTPGQYDGGEYRKQMHRLRQAAKRRVWDENRQRQYDEHRSRLLLRRLAHGIAEAARAMTGGPSVGR